MPSTMTRCNTLEVDTAKAQYLPFVVRGCLVLTRDLKQRSGRYFADNAALLGGTKGIGYRNSKSFDDKDAHNKFLAWGDYIEGVVEESDGVRWLKVFHEQAPPSPCGRPESNASFLQKLRQTICQECNMQPWDFDSRFDCVYSSSSFSGKRGSSSFSRTPFKGWAKLGLNVSTRYGSDEWIQKKAWPIAYHGTKATATVVRGIIRSGLKVRGGQSRAQHGERLGVGIYCSPNILKAMRYADTAITIDGVQYTLVFQCRVRPQEYAKPERETWLVKNSSDIRPCGILLHRFLFPDDQEIKYISPPRDRDKEKDWAQKLMKASTVREATSLGRSIIGLNKDLQHHRLRLVDVKHDIDGVQAGIDWAIGGLPPPRPSRSPPPPRDTVLRDRLLALLCRKRRRTTALPPKARLVPFKHVKVKREEVEGEEELAAPVAKKPRSSTRSIEHLRGVGILNSSASSSSCAPAESSVTPPLSKPSKEKKERKEHKSKKEKKERKAKKEKKLRMFQDLFRH